MAILQQQDENMLRVILVDPGLSQRVIDLLKSIGSGGSSTAASYANTFTIANQVAYIFAALSGKTIDAVNLDSAILIPSQYTLVGTTFTITDPQYQIGVTPGIIAGQYLNIAYH